MRCLKKTVTLLAVGMMLIVYMASFYNATCQDKGEKSSDILSGNIDLLVLLLTGLLGVGQAVEIYDHAFGHHHDHDQGHNPDQKQLEFQMRKPLLPISPLSINEDSASKPPRLPLSKIALRSVIPLTLGGFASYALWNQTKSLAQNNIIISTFVYFNPSSGGLWYS